MFDNKEEAEKKVDYLNKNILPLKYCPLVKGSCRKDCVCFKEAYVHKNVKGEFEVLGFRCSNYMLMGE